jgi:hypothetical protein
MRRAYVSSWSGSLNSALLVHPSTANADAFSVFHCPASSYLVRVYSKNILIANFGLDADNSLMSAPKKMPHDGVFLIRAHCQKEVIEPKTRQISSTFLVTEYVFQADGTRAIEVAADGCAFWQFFIRDFQDKDGRACRPDMYVPSQCSNRFFPFSFAPGELVEFHYIR